MNEKAALASSSREEHAGTDLPRHPPAYDSLPSTSTSQSQPRSSRPRAQTTPNSPLSLLPTAPSIPKAYAHIPLGRYHVPNSTVSPDKTSLTIYSPELSSNPAALEAFLADQMALPPRPTVRILARVPNHPLPLFDLHLDLFSHVAGIGGERSGEECGKWAFTKVKGMDAAGSSSGSGSSGWGGGGSRVSDSEPIRMDEKAALFDGRPDPTGAGFWIRRFCADGGYAKKLIFRRSVQNWDTGYLANLLRALILSTG